MLIASLSLGGSRILLAAVVTCLIAILIMEAR
jgi:hypothetical protein